MKDPDIMLQVEDTSVTTGSLLDDLTSLAAHATQSPASLLLLCHPDRLETVSYFGLAEVDAKNAANIPIHFQVISDGLVMSNLATPSVVDQVTGMLGVRFYAGVRLLQSSGEVLGVLCILDWKARELTPEDKRALWKCSRLAAVQLQSSPAPLTAPAPERSTGQDGLVRELTLARNVAEENLLRERNLSDSIINSLPGIFYLFNKEGRFLRWNKNLEKTTGYSGDEVAQMEPLEFFTPADRPQMAETIKQVFENGQAAIESMARMKDGTLTPYYFTGSLMLYHGQACVLGVAMNITERKRVEQRQMAIAKLGQSLSSATTPEEAARIIGNISDELFHWDAYALNLYHPKEKRISPVLNVDTVRGKRQEIPAPNVPSFPSVRSRRILEEGAELVLKDEPLHMSDETSPFGDTSRPSASIMLVPVRNHTKVIGILSIHSYKIKAYDRQDLILLQSLADHCGGALERIRAEQELKSSEKLFHSIWENSVDGMRLTDEAGTIVAVNEAFCSLVGIPEKELVGQPFTVMYSLAENHDQLLFRYQQRFKNKNVEKTIERKLTIRSGSTVDLEVTNSVIELPDKRLVLGLFRDITEHKRAEEELRRSEAQLRLVWENSLDGMRLLDERGIFLMVNEAFCRMVDKPREDLLGHPLASIYEPGQAGEIMRLFCERFRERMIPAHREKEVTLWNGKMLFWELTNSLLEVEEQPTLCLSVIRDMTVSKRVQRKIQQLEQQRALEKERDRIARDMHDDVGGSLTRITLLSEIAEAEIAAGKIIASEESKARIQKISMMSREVVRNVDEIVWAVDPGNDSLEKFASYICHLAEELLKVTDINYRLDLPTMLPNFYLGSDVRHNLFLVVKECLNNVVKHSEATEVSLQMGIADTEFTITISDNGKGFETGKLKPFSNGLSNMRKRMDKIGGAIRLKSQPGHGTTVALAIHLGK
jgi:PAS domain S-box-containing protein